MSYNPFSPINQKKATLLQMEASLSFKKNQVSHYEEVLPKTEDKLSYLMELEAFSNELPRINDTIKQAISSLVPIQFVSSLSVIFGNISVRGRSIAEQLISVSRDLVSHKAALIEAKAELKLLTNEYNKLNDEINELYA